MATESPFCLVTPRDRDIFQALDRCPLTVRQLLTLSQTFSLPFTTERRVQERMHTLCAVGRVRQWPYATAGHGALGYYTLTPLGYRILHGPEASPSGRGLFSPVGIARQTHTRSLADFIVHLLVAARRDGVTIASFHRENVLRLVAGDERLYPDSAIAFALPGGTTYRFFVEIDNSTETIRSGTSPDAWERKLRFYDAYQDAQAERFRVLVLVTGGPRRLQHILDTAAGLTRNPRRSLVYGIQLREFLRQDRPLSAAAFTDHRGREVGLLPGGAHIPSTNNGNKGLLTVLAPPR